MRVLFSYQYTLPRGGDAEDLANITGEAEDSDSSEAWEMIFYEYFGEELAEEYCGDPSLSIRPA